VRPAEETGAARCATDSTREIPRLAEEMDETPRMGTRKKGSEEREREKGKETKGERIPTTRVGTNTTETGKGGGDGRRENPGTGNLCATGCSRKP